jgi:hypothetical protein
MSCRKQAELVSLRAAVMRFESGIEMKTILNERDKALRKTESLEKQVRQLRDENKSLKHDNRSLSQSFKSLEERYERLLSAYEAYETFCDGQKTFQTDSFFRRMESVISELNAEILSLMQDITEKAGLIRKLKAQITRDNTNSSIPSSQRPNHMTPPNNREKTGRKPGGQKGHIGHGRKKLEPTVTYKLPAPDDIAGDPDYYRTGRTITKQLIRISLNLEVIQYEADEYRNHKTRRKTHAVFPEGLNNEVEYDASVCALIALLHSHGNMSYDKISEILSDLTDGKLTPSKGMMADLEKKFSIKSVQERQQIFNRMLVYPYMHIDGTAVRVSGKNGQVLIETSPGGTLLYHTGVKGNESVKGTPAEKYDGTMVHDGEATFFNYGKEHQGCLVHELRYLKGSMDNEPHLSWASLMREFLQGLIHYVKEVKGQERTELTLEEIKSFEEQYEALLDLAEKEYTDHPPNKRYYIDGYNTMKRLKKHKEHYLHFLYDISIPNQNNPAELVARKVKMHSKQSGGYRSDLYSQYYCDLLSVIESNLTLGLSRYQTLLDVFEKH